jgi:hypothetical protein
MTFSTDPRTLPVRPPSEVEWEDLLLRLDIMPRALRVAIEDAPADAAMAEALEDAVESEVRIQEELDAMARGADAPVSVVVDLRDGSPAGLLAQFTRLRTRTFAMVQRRGLNVWDWTSRGGGPLDGATAYQLLQAAARADGELLATIRNAGREETAA